MVNYYQVLGVANFASPEEVKAAYRKLSKQLHPDLHNGSVYYTEKFKELQAAYDCLGKPAKRETYDLRLHYYLDNPINENSTTTGSNTYYYNSYTAPRQQPVYTKKGNDNWFSGRMFFRILYLSFIIFRISTCDTFHSSDSYVPDSNTFQINDDQTQKLFDSIRTVNELRDSFLNREEQDSSKK